MPKSDLILSLAKVLVAAAWADEEVSHDEINALKDLLFHLPGLSARDWAELDIYIDSPIDPSERNRLLHDLRAAIRTRKDKEIASETLERLIQADGTVTPEERAVANEIQSAIDSINTNIFSRMGKMILASAKKRSRTVAGTANREQYLEDFIRNRIYYKMKRKLGENEAEIPLSDEEFRKLCLASGLLSRVAFVDKDVTTEERASIVEILRKSWDLRQETAALVAETAISAFEEGVDYYRLSREFFIATDEGERIKFVRALFQVAAADGDLSHDETEEIRKIAQVLKLTHKQFIDAKLSARS
ncbi:MAG: TerB family tellurite resistance protein [Anaerolineales bacterium]